MWGIRRQVSLLLEHGHTQASRYPVGMVWDEARLVGERINRSHATEAVLIKLAVSAVLSEEAGKEFSERIAKLNEE